MFKCILYLFRYWHSPFSIQRFINFCRNILFPFNTSLFQSAINTDTNVVFFPYKVNIKFDLCIVASTRTTSLLYFWKTSVLSSWYSTFTGLSSGIEKFLNVHSPPISTHLTGDHESIINLFSEYYQFCWSSISHRRRKIYTSYARSVSLSTETWLSINHPSQTRSELSYSSCK